MTFRWGRAETARGRMSAATGTPISGDTAVLPPIQPGSSIRVILSPIPAADGASVLQSAEKDIRLENGTRLEIGLTAAP